MKKMVSWLVISLMMSGTARAQTIDTPRVSPKLALAGVVTTLIGASLVFHWGYDNVRVLDDTYCVSSTSVDAGSCGTPKDRQIGLALIGAGVGMVWIGGRKKRVRVSPQVSKTSKAVNVSVQWGGARTKRP